MDPFASTIAAVLEYSKPRVHLSPADYVIHVFGGVRKTARAIGLEASAVSGWRNRLKRKDQLGLIPTRIQRKVLEAARVRGLDLTADDLISGRDVVVESLEGVSNT